MMENIETKVARTILQQPEQILIGDTAYQVAPPSTATLILMSEAAARMPHVRLDTDNIVDEVLSIARDCRPLGEFCAIMILGAKGLSEQKKIVERVEKRRLWGLIKSYEQVAGEVVIDRKAELSQKLLEDLQPHELYTMTAHLLSKMQIADFFGLTTFLTETNLLRQTRKVVETTASGR